MSVFSLQMSGPDTVGDDDDTSRKRKSKNLYVGKIYGPHPSDGGGGAVPAHLSFPCPLAYSPCPVGQGQRQGEGAASSPTLDRHS